MTRTYLPIPCPACGRDDYICVMQTNGARALVDGRDRATGDYVFVGMASGPDLTDPVDDGDTTDDVDAAGRALLRCANCGQEWRDTTTS